VPMISASACAPLSGEEIAHEIQPPKGPDKSPGRVSAVVNRTASAKGRVCGASLCRTDARSAQIRQIGHPVRLEQITQAPPESNVARGHARGVGDMPFLAGENRASRSRPDNSIPSPRNAWAKRRPDPSALRQEGCVERPSVETSKNPLAPDIDTPRRSFQIAGLLG